MSTSFWTGLWYSNESFYVLSSLQKNHLYLSLDYRSSLLRQFGTIELLNRERRALYNDRLLGLVKVRLVGVRPRLVLSLFGGEESRGETTGNSERKQQRRQEGKK